MARRENTQHPSGRASGSAAHGASGAAASRGDTPDLQADQQLRWALEQHARELVCLRDLSAALRSEGPLADIFAGAAALIAAGWKYPEIARVRIVFDGKEYVAAPFEPTDWRLTSDITITGEKRGQLQVYYVEELPDLDEGPFTDSQRTLADAIAGLLAQGAEKKLTDEALWFQSNIIEQTIEGIKALDMQGNIILANGPIAAMHGYEPDELIGKHISILHAPKQVHSVEAAMRQAFATGQFVGEIAHVKRDGSVFPAMMHMALLRDDSDEPIGMIGTCIDITDHKQAEEDAREQARLNQVFMDSMPCVAMLVRPHTHEIVACNETARKAGCIVGKTCYGTWAKRESPCPWCLAPKVRATGKPNHVELEAFGAVWDAHCLPLADDLYLHYAFDITDRKRAEEELLAERRRLRALAGELSVAEDMERQRISSALHDNVSQELAAAKIKIGLLVRSMPSTEHAEPLDEVFQMIDRTLQDVTSLTFQLCPPVLYRQGLAAALKWLVERFDSRHDESFEFVGQGISLPLSDEVRGLVFQSVRELLTNVVKHAQARRVSVTAETEGDEVKITVTDDGVGFDTVTAVRPDDEAGGFGLFSIRHRIGYFGGRLDIQPAAQGSRITVTIPLVSEDQS